GTPGAGGRAAGGDPIDASAPPGGVPESVPLPRPPPPPPRGEGAQAAAFPPPSSGRGPGGGVKELSLIFRCSSNGKSLALKTRRPLARTQPPELTTVPDLRSLQTLTVPLARLHRVHDGAEACYLAMVDVRVRFPPDA